MPTFFAVKRFKRQYEKLTAEQKILFMQAVALLVESIRRGRYHKSLRIKRFHGQEGVWEITWAPNGRALFKYGKEVKPGEAHVIWLNVGTHDIFK
ncbi:MAG: hypothetical protein ABFD69_15890 [Candidatus Sumerlaeia bacterium]